MKQRNKAGLWFASVVLIMFALFLFPAGLFMASNLAAGIYSSIFERRPTRQEIVGSYVYNAPWGTATLALEDNGKLRETLVDRGGSTADVSGTWSFKGQDNYVDLDLRPFISIQDEDHGRKDNVAGLPAFKPRFGETYVEVNDDLGEKFIKQ